MSGANVPLNPAVSTWITQGSLDGVVVTWACGDGGPARDVCKTGPQDLDNGHKNEKRQRTPSHTHTPTINELNRIWMKIAAPIMLMWQNVCLTMRWNSDRVGSSGVALWPLGGKCNPSLEGGGDGCSSGRVEIRSFRNCSQKIQVNWWDRVAIFEQI